MLRWLHVGWQIGSISLFGLLSGEACALPDEQFDCGSECLVSCA
jgi:hypothetical protein